MRVYRKPLPFTDYASRLRLQALCMFIALIALVYPMIAFAQTDKPIPVAVSILPQRYFVEKIGGQLVQVEVMIPPGATPETYDPRPGQMSALSQARIYFAIGVPFETVWLPKMVSMNPKIVVVHTEKNIEKRKIENHFHPGEAAHRHAHEEGDDPHIWLSPPLVILQAREIFEALAAADPKNRAFYEANYKKFGSELLELDVSLSRLLVSEKPGAFMVFHPAWGYFADAYGLRQEPVEVEGSEPRARDLDDFIKRARQLQIKVIFIQPQYSPKTAQTIAEAVGASLVEADDLAPDWENNIRQVAAHVAAALGR